MPSTGASTGILVGAGVASESRLVAEAEVGCFDSVELATSVSPTWFESFVVVVAAAAEIAVALPDASTATAGAADVEGCVQARRALVVKAVAALRGWLATGEEEATSVVVTVVAVNAAGLRFRLVGRLRWTGASAAAVVVSAVSALVGLSMTKAIVSPRRTAAPGRTFQQKSL